MDERTLARFWAKVAKSDDGCWLWTASTRGGYGRFFLDGRLVMAHRVSYEIHAGPIPKGHYVCHRCDMPGCVNPRSLHRNTG